MSNMKELDIALGEICEKYNLAMDTDNEGQIIIYTGIYKED